MRYYLCGSCNRVTPVRRCYVCGRRGDPLTEVRPGWWLLQPKPPLQRVWAWVCCHCNLECWIECWIECWRSFRQHCGDQ